MPPLRIEVDSTIANWILGLALTVPCAIILLVQGSMLGSSPEAALNVEIAAVMVTVGGAILTARLRAEIDFTARTVTWRHTVFGLTWRKRVIAAEEVERLQSSTSRRGYFYEVVVFTRDGKERVLKSMAKRIELGAFDQAAEQLGWAHLRVDRRG